MKNEITAIYVRVSTTKDSQKDSPEHQKGLCEEKARTMHLDVQYIYEDRDTGTSIVAREEIQRLINDAKSGFFQTIIFASLSRFSRDTLDSLSLKRILVDALGLRLISIEEAFDSAIDDDELKFQIISAVNQKLSEQISLSSKRGIRQSALKGNYTGSIPPFGYKKINIEERKTIVPDENTKHIVELIFNLYTAQKMGEKAIVNYLNDNIIPAYKGGVWGLSSVQRILTNEVYIGENVFSKYEVKKVYNDLNNMSDRSKKQVQIDKLEWERTSIKTHEAIIEEDIFLLAQETRLLRGGGKRGGIRNKVNIFAGFIFCEHCGSAMVCMKSGKSKKVEREYRYLICSARRRQGEKGCENNLWLPYYEFREGVISEVSNKLKEHINIGQVVKEHENKILIVNQVDFQKEINKLEKSLESHRKLLFEIRKQKMLNEIDEQQYTYEKEQYEKQIQLTQIQISKLSQRAEKSLNTNNAYSQIAKALENLVGLNYDDFDEMRLVLQKLIEKITVSKEAEVQIITPLGQLE